MHQGEPIGESGQPVAGDVQCGRIAVDTYQAKSGQLAEKALGVPTGTERAVEQYRARSVDVVAGQCREQQFEAAAEQHGHMTETTSGVRHESTFPT